MKKIFCLNNYSNIIKNGGAFWNNISNIIKNILPSRTIIPNE